MSTTSASACSQVRAASAYGSRYWRRNGDGTHDGVPVDPRAERVLVGVQHEVPHRDAVLGEARADLAPVLLDQDGHRHHQGAAGVVEDPAGGLDDERPPRRPVLEVVRLRQPGRDVHQRLADLLGVEAPASPGAAAARARSSSSCRAVGAVDPDDHGREARGRPAPLLVPEQPRGVARSHVLPTHARACTPGCSRALLSSPSRAGCASSAVGRSSTPNHARASCSSGARLTGVPAHAVTTHTSMTTVSPSTPPPGTRMRPCSWADAPSHRAPRGPPARPPPGWTPLAPRARPGCPTRPGTTDGRGGDAPAAPARRPPGARRRRGRSRLLRHCHRRRPIRVASTASNLVAAVTGAVCPVRGLSGR